MSETLLPEVTPPEPKSYFEALLGPGGKFDKTKYTTEQEALEALARGKWEADKFIEVKNKSFDDMSKDYIQLREQMNTQASLQELLDQYRNQTPAQQPQAGNEVSQPQYDPKQLESLIDTRFEQNIKTRKEQENFLSAKAKLTERYGANYSTAVTTQLEELGMSEAEFNQMAKTNPKLFERTFLPPKQSEDFQSPPRSTSRFTAQEQKRTWNYYQQMKKDNPRVYSDPKTQLQLMKDYETLGRDFEDGDFHQYN